jgi:hypothetical protein
MDIPEKVPSSKENLELELENCKFRLKEFEKKGLDLYLESEHRELLKKWILNKLNEDIDFFKEKVRNAGN